MIARSHGQTQSLERFIRASVTLSIVLCACSERSARPTSLRSAGRGPGVVAHAFVDREGNPATPAFPKWWDEYADSLWAEMSRECSRTFPPRNDAAARTTELHWLANLYTKSAHYSDALLPELLRPHEPSVWGYFDQQGWLQCRVECVLALPFSEDRAAILVERPEGRKWGFIDITGDFVVEPQFEAVEDFSQGVAAVCVRATGVTTEQGTNHHGEMDTRAAAGLWGYIDKNGETTVEAQFLSAGRFVNGLAPVSLPRVSREGIRAGFVDKSGQVVIGSQNWIFAREFAQGLAPVLMVRQRRFGFVKWDDTGWGYVDRHGRVVFEAQFEGAEPFSEGLAAVRLDGKWGYIDASGGFAIEAQFPSAFPFRGGVAFVGELPAEYLNEVTPGEKREGDQVLDYQVSLPGG